MYINDAFINFAAIPRLPLVQLSHHAPTTNRTHPWTSEARRSTESIAAALSKFKVFSCFTAPVHSDVWFRLLFRMIPVNYKKIFLQTVDPRAILCTYANCNDVETERHALHDCSKVAPLWEFHQLAWNQFGISFSWHSIIHPELFTVNFAHKQHKSILFRLWYCLTAQLLHTLYIHRNYARFERKQEPHLESLPERTILMWSCAVRSWLRIADAPTTTSIHFFLNQLGSHPLYRPIWSKHPALFRHSMLKNKSAILSCNPTLYY